VLLTAGMKHPKSFTIFKSVLPSWITNSLFFFSINLIVAPCIFVESLQFINQRMHVSFHVKHFKTLRHVSILSDYHQGALFRAKVILQYSQFNSYLQTRCCGSISCVVEQWLGVRPIDAHLATAPQHMICCHNTSFANTN